jgi:multiple sugar transport system ATP-binding protein
MGRVSLQGIRKNYGTSEVIRGIDLEVRDGELMVFVGPSGCGKSTTLRMIAGLEQITSGELAIDGVRANDMHPADRGAAMVFQSYALYPHMTVAENMGFALKMAGVSKASRDEQVARAAQVLKISDLLARFPKELSGGQRQRVAIGRAIVRDPKVFLFDEPLSNLDASLRVSMRIELSRLHKELGRTMIYVTHDQVEAMTLGDRIAIFNQGVIEQVGSPMELYQRPANEFVAGFLGTPKINMIDTPPANASGTYAQLWNCLVSSSKNTVQRAGLRPENLRVVSADEGIAAQVELLEHLGDASILYLRVEGVGQLLAAKVSGEPAQLSLGQAVGLKLEERHALHFDQAGRLLS